MPKDTISVFIGKDYHKSLKIQAAKEGTTIRKIIETVLDEMN